MNTQKIHELSARYFDSAIRIRREIHRYPELAFEEKKTSETIINELNRIGLDYEENIAETGIVAVINGVPGERSVLIRADMDALPIREDTGLPFASINDGKMHACGHDAHVASALLAGQILLNLKDYFCGSVYFVFQPAAFG